MAFLPERRSFFGNLCNMILFETRKDMDICTNLLFNFLDICTMKVPTNRIKDVVNHYVNEITPLYGVHEAKQMVYMLTEHFYGIDRVKLALNPEFRLSESELSLIDFAVNDLKKYKPIQYIIGQTEFCGRMFQVTENVLIPRHETEELVQLAIDFAKAKDGIHQILDIGTGSGCIAISLALELTETKVSALDISIEALALAKKNAEKLAAKVNFFEYDILKQSELGISPKWDLIVSNPPYVTQADKGKMSRNVLAWEPHLALFVTDENPLIFYKRILDFSKIYLNPNGCIMLEINELYGAEVVVLFQANGFSSVKLHCDIHQKPRFVTAKYE